MHGSFLVSGDGSAEPINRIAFGTSGEIPSPSNTEITEPFIKEVICFAYPAAG
jgi:hypothetical protein